MVTGFWFTSHLHAWRCANRRLQAPGEPREGATRVSPAKNLFSVYLVLSYSKQRRRTICGQRAQNLLVLRSPLFTWRSLKIIRLKYFCGVKFSRFRSKFFNGRLQYGPAPGAFLAFRLLPGIERDRYCWLYIVVGRTFTRGLARMFIRPYCIIYGLFINSSPHIFFCLYVCA